MSNPNKRSLEEEQENNVNKAARNQDESKLESLGPLIYLLGVITL